MNLERIQEDLIEYVFSKSDLENKNDIPIDQSLLITGVLDSFAVVELVEYIESNWSIQILDSEFNQETMGSISKMASLILLKSV